MESKRIFRSFLSTILVIFGLAVRTNLPSQPFLQDSTEYGVAIAEVSNRETTPKSEAIQIADNFSSNRPQTTTRPTSAATPKPAATGAGNTRVDSISVAGRNVPIFNTNSTSIDAGSRVAKYTPTNKFFFGHNSGSVFGGLKTLSIGSTFTITLNGNTTTYRVANIQTFDKVNGKLTQNGSGNYMYSITNAIYKGSRYDVSLMTCAGQMLGGGDATQRLVIFANRI